ncbi:MAG: hypothetical protein J5658_08275 [Prevotella sp.]|nr:hypothetical protein [Prevotella sp.]
MTDYEYILQQVKLFHFKGWEDGVLRKCVDMLPNLSRQELTSLYYSKWVKNDRKFREVVFDTLFADKVGKREERIKNLDTDALIEEFKDKKSGNVALIRKEMRERYKANKGYDRSKIATAFNASIKMDQQWVKSQVRKEQYGDSGNKYQWKKTSWK